jgi:hypothetical protein
VFLLRKLDLFDTELACMEFVLLNGALLPGYIELKIDIIPANVSQGAANPHCAAGHLGTGRRPFYEYVTESCST